MQAIPLIHRSALIPAIGILDEIGAPTATLLRRERLPVFDHDSTTYVPIRSTWAFVRAAAETQGIWDLGLRIAERVTVGHASRWGPRVSNAVTLRHAIQIMKNWIGFDIPDLRIGLEQRGDRQWFWRDYPPDRQQYAGYWLGEQQLLGLMIQIVRMVEGPDWFPRQLHVQAPAHEWAFERRKFAGDASITFGAQRTAIELPAGSLDRRLPSAASDSIREAPHDTNERPAVDLQGSLNQVLKSLACERRLTLELGAQLVCGSKRSLQRALANGETSWREVVDRVHLETALDLMEQPRNSLSDIAGTLGYSQYAHFYRAFRRWTGESPGECRERLEARGRH